MKKLVITTFAVFGLMLFSQIAKSADVMISEGNTVKFHYTLTVDGEVADSSEGKDPLEYTDGKSMIIPGLEKQLLGMKVGDKKDVVVSPADGYGELNDKLFIEVPKNAIAPGVVPEIGMVLQVQGQDGRPLAAVVEEIREATLYLNFNHPLAGKELMFSVEIVEIK